MSIFAHLYQHCEKENVFMHHGKRRRLISVQENFSPGQLVRI